MTKTHTLSPEALAVLSTLEIDGNAARISSGQLDRKLYTEINGALEALGGKWERKAKAHVFAEDPSDKIDAVVYTGSFTAPKGEYDFFTTPPGLAARVVDQANILSDRRPHTVLEPSAGNGAIARVVRGLVADVTLTVVELQPNLREILTRAGFNVHPEPDFLKFHGQTFTRIVMNPPFSGTKGLTHVEHAYSLLAPGGRLVAIMPASVRFRQDRRFREFRQLVDAYGHIDNLPDGSFKESGTMVRTVLVTMNAPAASGAE